ncbi:protease pro-enzyme activation domain-containing protein, partial [Caballeronia sordidicola]|uniref:protease pro-enzyme activation domain-containing protein n=1 Tax=Caballeronia sordidicola TaxID=196367 RepID=UPI00117D9C2F
MSELLKVACFRSFRTENVMSQPTKSTSTVSNASSLGLRSGPRDYVPYIVSQLEPNGRLSSTDRLNISIALPLRNATELDELLRDLYDPASARFHRYVTADQFTRDFGPTERDYHAVLEFAESRGLKITSTHHNRTLVSLSGQVADIEKMFQVNILTYSHPIEQRPFYAPDAEPHIHQGLEILRVNGLDDYYSRKTPLRFARQRSASRSGPAVGSAPGGGLISRDFRNAYAPGVSLDGAGQAVGIYTPPHGFDPNDIISYQMTAGISPLVPVNKVLVDGIDYPPDSYSIEVTLDIQMAIAMAPGLSQVLVYEGEDGVSILNRMATDNIAKQLTSSWPTPPENSSADQVYKQFMAQGQTFFCASGDAGAYYPTQPFSVDDPNITAVSGTQLILTVTGDTWESEIVWKDNNFGSGGGGTMGHYPLPDWQKNIDMSLNQGSTTSRNSPDVSMVAANIYMILNGSPAFVEGTSAASPLWAGYMALINQRAAQSAKQPIGLLNPSLYALGKSSSYASYFHDITVGNNLTKWNTQPNNANQYFAVPGYDCCTGWGTPTGSALIDAIGRDGPPQDLIPSSAIAVSNEQDRRLSLFSLAQDKSVYRISQTAPNGNWSPWLPLLGRQIRQISVARNSDGRLELFALGGDRAIYHIWQTDTNGGWGDWASLAGHDLQQIAVANNADGRLELFALGGDRAIYHIWQTVANGGWGDWASLAGHDLQQIAVANNADGRLELFALGGDRAIYHIWQTVA